MTVKDFIAKVSNLDSIELWERKNGKLEYVSSGFLWSPADIEIIIADCGNRTIQAFEFYTYENDICCDIELHANWGGRGGYPPTPIKKFFMRY